MKKRRHILLILSVLFVFSSLSSLSACAQDTGVNTAGTSGAVVTQPAEKDILGYLPGADYEGYEFRMLIRNAERWINDMYVETETGDVVDDALYRRNQTVSERYNVLFKLIKSSNDNYETDAIETIIANDDAYDLIVPHPRASFVYANQGLFMDWNTDLPNINLDNPWWDRDARANFSINHRLYVMVGDISYQCMGACDVMLFNKALFDKYNLPYPYESVNSNTWTFDTFEKYLLLASSDLNGDGKYSESDDQFGYVTQYWVGPIEALYVAGQRILQKDENDIPYISLYNETTLNVFNWYYGILDSDAGYVQTTGHSWDGGFLSIFSEGRSMFIDMNMDDVITMRTMDADFGIIPWPKPDESSEFCTNVDSGTNLFGVPVTNPDPSRTGHILESLCVLGSETVMPAYYEIALQTKFARDEDSAAMLDIIKQSRVFDLGYYNNSLVGVFANQFAAFAATDDRDFTSWYEKNLKSAQASLDALIAVYTQ